MKHWKTTLAAFSIFLFLGGINTTLAAPDPITDPNDTSNPIAMKGAPIGIMPKAFAQYAPAGNFLTRVGMGAASTPPNPSAVYTIIIGLVRASSGETTLSKGIWTFAMAVVFFGVTLSGFITFKTISAGKETPGLGSVKWVGKTMMCFILVNYVASAMPKVLITICDDISDKAGEWVAQDQEDYTAIDAVGRRMINNHTLQFNKWAEEIAMRVQHNNPTGPDRDTLMKAIAEGMAAGGREYAAARAEIKELAATSKEDAETINKKISNIAKNTTKTAVKGLENFMSAGFDKIKQNDSSIRGAIMGQSTVDLSGLVYPVQIIRTMIYISVVYIAISIWSLPIAILMWAGIFSLPAQWGMNNILFSGIKTFLTIILTMVLVMVYTSGTLSGEAERMKMIEGSPLWSAFGSVGASLSLITNVATGILTSSDTSIAGVANFLTGTSTDLIIASMLIFTAPAQAAAIIKGANGIAESAKNAMMAGGASYGMKQALGGMSGAGNASTSLGGGTVSLASFQSNMGPKK